MAGSFVGRGDGTVTALPRLGRIRHLAWAAGALACAGPVAQAAVLISNGSFESGPARQAGDPVGFKPVPAGSTTITSWLVTGQAVDYIDSFWQASDGTHSLDLNNLESSGVQQIVDTIAGRMYLISFDMAGNPESGPTLKTLNLSAGGKTQGFSFLISGKSPTNMGWLRNEFEFTATSNQTTVSFQSTSSGGFGPAIDNVVMVEVPEPGCAGLAAVLAAVLGRRVRGRRVNG